MTKHGAWSVKGIDQRAREAAREAAREEGLTIGEYINRMLLEEGEAEQAALHETSRQAYPRAVADTYAPERRTRGGAFDELIERLEAVEARSTIALRGIDQSIVGLVTRLNETDAKSDEVAGNVDNLVDDLQDTRRKLQSKVRALEEDNRGSQDIESLKSLEEAVARLSQRIHDENSRHRDDIGAVRRKVDTGLEDLGSRVTGVEERVDTTLSEAASRIAALNEKAELRAEGTARHLSERVSHLEGNLSSKLEQMGQFEERMNNVEGEVAGALSSIEAVMTRMQERLHEAESSTNSALEGLENTFHRLDRRIDAIAQHASPEAAQKLRAQFEERFEGLTAELRSSIESSREELAREIEKAATEAASPQAIQQLDGSVQELEKRMSASEERSSRALESMTGQVRRISTALDRRLRTVESRDPGAAVDEVRGEMQRMREDVSAQNDDMVDRVTAQMTSMADEFDARVGESEQRSATAIEQVGEQVASVTQRLQARQERALSDMKESVDTAHKQQNKRLSDALSGVSDRLEKMQAQQASSLSPVQKAIASLATRLEALEDFTSPPHADTEPYEAPGFAPPSVEHFGDAIESGNAFEIEDADEPHEAENDPFESFGPDMSEAPAFEPETGFAAESGDEGVWTDDAFEAGVPDISELENEFDMDETPVEPAAHDHEAEYETELMETPEAEMADPLSELSDWDDGGQETRESDIFGEDDGQAPETFLAPEWTEEDHYDEDLAGLSLSGPDSPEALASETPEIETARHDDEAMDYLSRARRAALAATTDSNARNSYEEPNRRKSRVPLVAAVSVIALATAAAGTFVTLRGLQSDADEPAIQTRGTVSAGPATARAASVAVPDAAAPGADPVQTAFSDIPPTDPLIEPLRLEELAGLSESEAAAVEEELFDSEAPGRAEEPADAPQAGAVDFASLPTIPQSPTLQAAASAGDPVAQFVLGEQYLNDGDYTEGPTLVRRAAESGLAAAQYRLAKLHERGLGVPKDLEAAREWTESAADGGNVKAMHDLAVYYAQGEGGAQNYAAAVEWFRKAADYGLTDSQYNLALLYESGLGISKSPTEALYWYEVARKQGDNGAASKIEALRADLTEEAAEQAAARAAGWTPTQWPEPANGNFGPQGWSGSAAGEQVSAVQTVLSALGYQPGPADGDMGGATVDAIKAYQSDNGLDATGVISPALVESLNQTVQMAAGNT